MDKTARWRHSRAWNGKRARGCRCRYEELLKLPYFPAPRLVMQAQHLEELLPYGQRVYVSPFDRGNADLRCSIPFAEVRVATPQSSNGGRCLCPTC